MLSVYDRQTHRGSQESPLKLPLTARLCPSAREADSVSAIMTTRFNRQLRFGDMCTEHVAPAPFAVQHNIDTSSNPEVKLAPDISSPRSMRNSSDTHHGHLVAGVSPRTTGSASHIISH